ncbi:unnamed protein product [Spirodela intermedia]|uniref:Uncharacterized protein n=2 Tax=Spirodela intermedia TaxID=51605 RepID=A0A7I8I8J4_SPIIN|nr:unnamed protein product [Spirodela intermedia]CAA6653959.1 unnamed protein product [Spirodela intermedia]CAA7388397.1 unnamed protein product [Spirodela intermedia]
MQDLKTYLAVAPLLSTLVWGFSRFTERN